MSLQPVLGRECGECALCCKILPIPGLKEAGPWCIHCSSHQGCDNYENRPTPCRTFFCSYIVDPGLNEDWKPTRSRFVLSLHASTYSRPEMRVVVDPIRPDAWKKNPYYASFKQWSSQYYIIVSIGERRIVIFPDHDKDLGVIPAGSTIDMVTVQTPSGPQLTAQIRHSTPTQ